jgi:FkbM family methyltransferase
MNTAKEIVRGVLPRRIRRHRILFGPLRGEKLVTSWHDYPSAILGRTERPLLDWFARTVSLGETWLDIGAHYGYTAVALSRLVGAAGRVFAFEPMIATAGCVSQTRVLNRLQQLTVVPLALGCGGDLSSCRLPVVRGMIDSTADRAVIEESLLVARLDWLWPRICDQNEHIDGIKIDVQGMEVDTLRGMVDSLRRHAPKLVVEVHQGVDRKALLGLLAESGYVTPATPIEPLPGESEPQYVDDRSYAFSGPRIPAKCFSPDVTASIP